MPWYRRLDVRRLQRDSLLKRRSSFGWQWLRGREVDGTINIRPEDDRIILNYKHRQGSYGDWTEMEYAVAIERTPCHFGGERVWFRCPAVGCLRRVAVLYGAKYFVCRTCYRLAYQCQRETDSDRATRRAYSLRNQACDWGTIFDPLFRRKGMHKRTFERIKAQYFRKVYTAFSDFPKEQASLDGLIDFDLEELEAYSRP